MGTKQSAVKAKVKSEKCIVMGNKTDLEALEVRQELRWMRVILCYACTRRVQLYLMHVRQLFQTKPGIRIVVHGDSDLMILLP